MSTIAVFAPLKTNIHCLDMKRTVQGICNMLHVEDTITLKTVLYHGLKKEEKVCSVFRELLKVLKQQHKQKTKIKIMT